VAELMPARRHSAPIVVPSANTPSLFGGMSVFNDWSSRFFGDQADYRQIESCRLSLVSRGLGVGSGFTGTRDLPIIRSTNWTSRSRGGLSAFPVNRGKWIAGQKQAIGNLSPRNLRSQRLATTRT
jgi:hypothetical protein